MGRHFADTVHFNTWMYTAAALLQAGGSVIALPASEPLGHGVSHISVPAYLPA